MGWGGLVRVYVFSISPVLGFMRRVLSCSKVLVVLSKRREVWISKVEGASDVDSAAVCGSDAVVGAVSGSLSRG